MLKGFTQVTIVEDFHDILHQIHDKDCRTATWWLHQFGFVNGVTRKVIMLMDMKGRMSLLIVQSIWIWRRTCEKLTSLHRCQVTNTSRHLHLMPRKKKETGIDIPRWKYFQHQWRTAVVLGIWRWTIPPAKTQRCRNHGFLFRWPAHWIFTA